MQAVSQLYNTLLADQNHWFETKLVIDGVGTFTEDQLFSISTSSQLLQSAPTAGNAIAGEIDIKMILPDATIPRMACLRPYVRVCGNERVTPYATLENGTLYNLNGTIENDIFITDGATLENDLITFYGGSVTTDSSEWLAQGVYYIDTRKRTKNHDDFSTLEIHGFDDMLKAERNYPSTSHNWPYSDILVVQEIAATMGVSVDSRVSSYINKGYLIDLPVSYTMRETLGHIAAAYGGSFCMSPIGRLNFIPIYGLGG